MREQVVAVVQRGTSVASSLVGMKAVARSEHLGTSALHAGNWNIHPAMLLEALGSNSSDPGRTGATAVPPRSHFLGASLLLVETVADRKVSEIASYRKVQAVQLEWKSSSGWPQLEYRWQAEWDETECAACTHMACPKLVGMSASCCR